MCNTMLGNTSSITTTNNLIHAHVCCVFHPGEYEEPLVLDHHPSQTVINKHPPTATRHTIPYYFQFSFNWLSILSHLKWSTAARHLRTITKVPVFCSHCKIPGTRYLVQLSMSASSCYLVCPRSYLSNTEQIALPMYSFCILITSQHYYTRQIMISFYYNGKISKEEDQSCYRTLGVPLQWPRTRSMFWSNMIGAPTVLFSKDEESKTLAVSRVAELSGLQQPPPPAVMQIAIRR